MRIPSTISIRVARSSPVDQWYRAGVFRDFARALNLPHDRAMPASLVAKLLSTPTVAGARTVAVPSPERIQLKCAFRDRTFQRIPPPSPTTGGS